MNLEVTEGSSVSGEFVDLAGERYYAIRNVDKMAPFFISVVSSADHWLFVSSSGGLTAGRGSPDTALFPYTSVDKVHENNTHTGPKTLLRINAGGHTVCWEPFAPETDPGQPIRRNLYKNLLGNKLCFEELHQDLQLAFRYTWVSSDDYGFARQCELHNIGGQALQVELVDGLQNILPAGTPRSAQSDSSNLVDAYKWTELDPATGLALFTLYSGITDRAEPCESLKANTAFCLGLERPTVLISSQQLDRFRHDQPLEQELHRRGVRGAYLVSTSLTLAPGACKQWQIVTDLELGQGQVVELLQQLENQEKVAGEIARSVARGSDELARIMACADGFQVTAEENVSVHHYANVLFNVLRGGIFDDQYQVPSRDVARTLEHFNREVYQRHRELIEGLPEKLNITRLLETVSQAKDPQLERLCREYLPIRFGRRHGDPSRPWNQFAIKLKDSHGNRLLSYEGNWRDIFQNWEALAFSYPEFIESVIAKFVNASTVDGYNPYRITKEGIDWEVEEPDNPWSHIGYWGDHQIIYLLKLLELSRHFHGPRLGELLHQPIFSYANVPYRIRPFEALLEDPKSTVDFDLALAARIEQRVADMGADGKLVLDARGRVYQVNLLEKLLVPLLSRLGNLVIDGGIWMNTQRPEWNDANNALVGQGLSMVTLYYLRRYLHMMKKLLAGEAATVSLSLELGQWLEETAAALAAIRPILGVGPVTAEQRYQALAELGQAASRYRQAVYARESFSGTGTLPGNSIRTLLDDALVVVDHSISTNKRADGLYHAYNLLRIQDQALSIDNLYPMLEGQVAVLSAGALAPEEVATVVEALFDSPVYRPDQHSFMLYPDRPLPGFLEKNQLPADKVTTIALLRRMLADNDTRVVLQDARGCYRFNPRLTNVGKLNTALQELEPRYAELVKASRNQLRALYEEVFNHRAFTGRSGGMFAFEGLGSIYWHMVSKLLLAIQENYFETLGRNPEPPVVQRLGRLYYRVREGLGFNKTPAEYGAFPTDPYSHTPRHAGASQPGMTGQVKEEVLSRFGELGVRIHGDTLHFDPRLLRSVEFLDQPRQFSFLDVEECWQTLTVPSGGLAFTWCQVPVIYQLQQGDEPVLSVTWDNGETHTHAEMTLPAEACTELFQRSGRIRQLSVRFQPGLLFAD